ncbi:MAG: D52 family tumor protein [Firmicutes bacterium]|nr:D52 family tumor protein [Bacillota bacterium]
MMVNTAKPAIMTNIENEKRRLEGLSKSQIERQKELQAVEKRIASFVYGEKLGYGELSKDAQMAIICEQKELLFRARHDAESSLERHSENVDLANAEVRETKERKAELDEKVLTLSKALEIKMKETETRFVELKERLGLKAEYDMLIARANEILDTILLSDKIEKKSHIKKFDGEIKLAEKMTFDQLVEFELSERKEGKAEFKKELEAEGDGIKTIVRSVILDHRVDGPVLRNATDEKNSADATLFGLMQELSDLLVAKNASQQEFGQIRVKSEELDALEEGLILQEKKLFENGDRLIEAIKWGQEEILKTKEKILELEIRGVEEIRQYKVNLIKVACADIFGFDVTMDDDALTNIAELVEVVGKEAKDLTNKAHILKDETIERWKRRIAVTRKEMTEQTNKKAQRDAKVKYDSAIRPYAKQVEKTILSSLV